MGSIVFKNKLGICYQMRLFEHLQNTFVRLPCVNIPETDLVIWKRGCLCQIYVCKTIKKNTTIFDNYLVKKGTFFPSNLLCDHQNCNPCTLIAINHWANVDEWLEELATLQCWRADIGTTLSKTMSTSTVDLLLLAQCWPYNYAPTVVFE